MKTNLLILLFSISLLISVGCSNDCTHNRISLNLNDVKSTNIKTTDSTVISELFTPYRIHIVGEYVVMLTLAQDGSENALYLYNKKSCDFLGSFISYGNANNEVFHLNSSYFYNTSDSTFLMNTNIFDESEYLIKNNAIEMINKKRITNQKSSNILKFGSDKHILINRENNSDSEYILQTNTNDSTFTKKEMGTYPNFYNAKLDNSERFGLYNKWVTTTTKNSAYTFYTFIPLIRKYDSNLTLETEYILSDYVDYKIENIDTAKDVENVFFQDIQYYDNKIMIKHKGEFLLFNDNLELLNRFSLDTRFDKIRLYCFDNEYIYFFDANTSPTMMYKVKY